jgi:hypothetical protein
LSVSPLVLYQLICLSVSISVYVYVSMQVFLSVCLYIYLSLYLYVYMSVCLSVSISVCMHKSCLSVCLIVWWLFVCLYVRLSIHVLICLSVWCIPVCMYVSLSVCVSLSLAKKPIQQLWIYKKIHFLILHQEIIIFINKNNKHLQTKIYMSTKFSLKWNKKL